MRHSTRRIGMLAGLLLALLVGLAGCGASAPRPPQNQDEVPRISPAQLKERLDGGEDVLVVDARSEGEYAEQHIPGAISVPLTQVEARLDEFPRDKEIVFYCT